MLLRYLFPKFLLCFVAVLVVLGIGTSASAVPVQTTYSYIGADYIYQPGATFTWEGNPYQLPGTDYAAILGPRLTASVTLDGDTSSATGVYSTGYLHNPVGYRGVLEASFSSGSVGFGSSDFISMSLVNGVVTDWKFTIGFGSISSCGVGPFCAPGSLNTWNSADGENLRFYIPYPSASYGAQSNGPGTWALVNASPVPGPTVGAGLPSVLMAVAGFIGWRRSRRVVATKHRLQGKCLLD